ncbi:MAG: hypothetical protein LBR49_01635 [Tannerella sp.]|nr:hypothetical protein [Tannerella sp.]
MIKKYVLSIIYCIVVVSLMPGCDITKQLQGVYNLTNCDYKYHSISNLKLADINLSNGISALNTVKLLAVLNGSSSSLPLDFTLNMDVHNPNVSEAAFKALHYIIEIDDIEFTNGSVSQSFNVASGETKQLPLNIGVDLAKLISEHSKDAILGIAKNFIGIGNEATNVTVRLKPTFNIGGSLITSPVYVPVKFSFGGEKK